MRKLGTCNMEGQKVRPNMVCQWFQPKGSNKESQCSKCKFYEPYWDKPKKEGK